MAFVIPIKCLVIVSTYGARYSFKTESHSPITYWSTVKSPSATSDKPYVPKDRYVSPIRAAPGSEWQMRVTSAASYCNNYLGFNGFAKLRIQNEPLARAVDYITVLELKRQSLTIQVCWLCFRYHHDTDRPGIPKTFQ